jgi:hypothetical protein
MNSAQTFRHLLKNDIRRQGWLLYSWVIFGSVIIVLQWAKPDTFKLLLNGVGWHLSNLVTAIVCTGGFLGIYFAAPLILGMNILSADPVTGSDRFWMTRPVSGKVLFLEKSLLVFFIIGFHFALLHCIINLGFSNKEFFGIYAFLIPLFAILFAQLTILPRKFISVLCLIVFLFLMTQFFESTIASRVGFLTGEPIQISALPSILALLIPLVFVGIGIGNQYITRRTKRTFFFFVFSVVCAAGVTENSAVPLEFMEIKKAISCKGTIESSGEDRDCYCEERYSRKEREFRGNITSFNVPASEANCYWSPHATKNPNAQHWGDWIYQDDWFNFGLNGFDTIEGKPNFHNSNCNGLLNALNEELKKPSWLLQEKFMKKSFSQKAVFVSDKKDNRLPLQIFLKERKLTRILEGPLKKDNSIVFHKDGQFSFEKTSSDGPSISFKEEAGGTYKISRSSLSFNYFIVFYNPLLNEARLFKAPFSFESRNSSEIENVGKMSDEWRKDARIIVYHITDTGRAGLATLEHPTK